jgi:hypothetical protein
LITIQEMIYIAAIFTSFLILVLLAVNAWWQRETAGARPFALIMVASAWWMLGTGFMVTRDTPSAALIWYKLQFLGISTIPRCS